MQRVRTSRSRVYVSDHQIDPAFQQLCLNTSPFLDSFLSGRLFEGSVETIVSDKGRLTKDYANAWTDFYPSKAGCVYKSGSSWEQGISREARTVCRPDIAPVWVPALKKIINYLDSLAIKLTCINPFAWTNEGDETPFCPFLLTVGVQPKSLAHPLAVSATEGVKKILASINLADVEVAFQELEVERQSGGQPLLSLNPLADDVLQYRKAFSALPGVSIAPLEAPYIEGTGGLYLKIGDAVVLLTNAHVVRPPKIFPDNSGMQRIYNTGPKEYVAAVGTSGYSRAIGDMMMRIAKLTRDVETNENMLKKPSISADKRIEFKAEISKLVKIRNQLDALHTEITKYRSTPERRTIGWVLYSSPIGVDVKAGDEELGYTQDWGLVQIDRKMLDPATFEGNKLYFGDRFTPGDLAELMWPNAKDRARYTTHASSLMQMHSMVPAQEIVHQPHIDTNGMPALFVITNGGASGTRLGRANGLFSVKRTVDEDGIVAADSLEIGVISYGKGQPEFSTRGDSGASVVDRDGRVLGIVNGGAGSSDGTEVTFVSPFWRTLERIREVYPDARMYSA